MKVLVLISFLSMPFMAFSQNYVGRDFSWKVLQGVDFSYGDLRGANFRGADLRGANLRGAKLMGANFRDAKLQGANFDFSNVRDANFYGAILSGMFGLNSASFFNTIVGPQNKEFLLQNGYENFLSGE